MLHETIENLTTATDVISKTLCAIVVKSNNDNENLAFTDKIEIVKTCEQLNILREKILICQRTIRDVTRNAGTYPQPTQSKINPNEIHTGINLDDGV